MVLAMTVTGEGLDLRLGGSEHVGERPQQRHVDVVVAQASIVAL